MSEFLFDVISETASHIMAIAASNNATSVLPDPTKCEKTPSLEELNSAEVKRLVPTIVFLSTISAFGMFGNIMVIRLYRKRYKISNAYYFILCLSAVDLFSCCVAIPLEIATLLKQYNFDQLWLCKLSRCFNTLGTCSSCFILFFISLDRFRKVCKPFGWQVGHKMAKIVSLLLVILGAFVSWPAIFVYGKKTFHISEFNMTGTECSTAEEMSDTSYPLIYALVFDLLFATGIIVMSILYCIIGCELKRHAHSMKEFSRTMSGPTCLSLSAADVCDARDIATNEISKDDVSEETGKENKNHKHSKELENDNDIWTIDGNEQNTVTESHERSKKLCIDSKEISIDKTDYDIPRIKENGEEDNVNNVQNKSADEVRESAECKHIKTSTLSTAEVQSKSPSTIEKCVDCVKTSVSNLILRLSSMPNANKDRKESRRTIKGKSQFLRQARARKTAFIMFVISVAFILSFLPHLALILTRQINGHFVDTLSDTNRAVYKFFLRSYFLNCALNPIVYSICDSRFRSSIKSLLCMCLRQKSS